MVPASRMAVLVVYVIGACDLIHMSWFNNIHFWAWVNESVFSVAIGKDRRSFDKLCILKWNVGFFNGVDLCSYKGFVLEEFFLFEWTWRGVWSANNPDLLRCMGAAPNNSSKVIVVRVGQSLSRVCQHWEFAEVLIAVSEEVLSSSLIIWDWTLGSKDEWLRLARLSRSLRLSEFSWLEKSVDCRWSEESLPWLRYHQRDWMVQGLFISRSGGGVHSGLLCYRVRRLGCSLRKCPGGSIRPNGCIRWHLVTTNASCTQATDPIAQEPRIVLPPPLATLWTTPAPFIPLMMTRSWRTFLQMHLQILQLFQSRKLRKGRSDDKPSKPQHSSFVPMIQSQMINRWRKNLLRNSNQDFSDSQCDNSLTKYWRPDNDHLGRIVRAAHGIEEGPGLFADHTPSKFIPKENSSRTNPCRNKVNTVKESTFHSDAKLIKLRLSLPMATLKTLSLTRLRNGYYESRHVVNRKPYDVYARTACAMQETISLLLMVDVTT